MRGTFMADGNVLTLVYDDGCTVYKFTLESYTYRGWILWHINYTSIKLYFWSTVQQTLRNDYFKALADSLFIVTLVWRILIYYQD